MVTTESRNNLMILILVIVVGIMVLYFMTTFAGTMEKTAQQSATVVNATAKNVTDTFSQVVNLITSQIKLQEEERDTNKQNLALFLGTFQNQSNTMVDAIHDLKNTSASDRKNQTSVFVDTLMKSQNLTKFSINTVEERNAIMDRLIGTVANLTLSLSSTTADKNMTGNPIDNNSQIITGNLTPSLFNNRSQ